MLHAALERAVKERLIPRNPTEDCIAPKPRKIEMQILPSEDIHAYMEAAKARDLLPMFYLELVSGLRKGELVALRWDDLDIQNKTISVSKQYVRNPDGSLELTRPKTENSVRLVSIPQTAVELLIQEHDKHPNSPYMFPSPITGEMYHPDSVVNLHKKILKDAGLPHIRFHDLRHTFATTALQNGVDVKTVSSMLGHYDAGFTLRTYTHATRQKQDEAAQTMGAFMEQVMQKEKTPKRESALGRKKTSYPVRFKPFRTFRRVGHGVGRNFFGIPKTHFLQQKTPKIRRFQVFSGAAGRI